MRIQPVQGSGVNVGFDAASNSIQISNEGNTPFIYVVINARIPVDNSDVAAGYHTYHDFYEVNWTGSTFEKVIGGLYADYDTRSTCVKMFSVPYNLDATFNRRNFTGNGLIYLARSRGVDRSDGREIYEFLGASSPVGSVTNVQCVGNVLRVTYAAE
jgi:hypothetical protein